MSLIDFLGGWESEDERQRWEEEQRRKQEEEEAQRQLAAEQSYAEQQQYAQAVNSQVWEKSLSADKFATRFADLQDPETETGAAAAALMEERYQNRDRYTQWQEGQQAMFEQWDQAAEEGGLGQLWSDLDAATYSKTAKPLAQKLILGDVPIEAALMPWAPAAVPYLGIRRGLGELGIGGDFTQRNIDIPEEYAEAALAVSLLDPTNLLPGIGFGGDIARGTRRAYETFKASDEAAEIALDLRRFWAEPERGGGYLSRWAKNVDPNEFKLTGSGTNAGQYVWELDEPTGYVNRVDGQLLLPSGKADVHPEAFTNAKTSKPFTADVYRAEPTTKTGVPRTSRSYAQYEHMAQPEGIISGYNVQKHTVTLQTPLVIEGVQGELLASWAALGDTEAARLLKIADDAGKPPKGWYREVDSYIAQKASVHGYDGIVYKAGERSEVVTFGHGEQQKLLEATKALVPATDRSWGAPRDFAAEFRARGDASYIEDIFTPRELDWRYSSIPLPPAKPTFDQIDEAIEQVEELGKLTDLPDSTKGLLARMKIEREAADQREAISRVESELRHAMVVGDDAGKAQAFERLQGLGKEYSDLRAKMHDQLDLAESALAPFARDPKWADVPRVMPETDINSWEQAMRQAISKPHGLDPLGRVGEQAAKVPGLRNVLGVINPNLIYADGGVGHIFLGGDTLKRRLLNSLHVGMENLRGQGMPFETKKGIEARTGESLKNVLEDWKDTYAFKFADHPKIEQMNQYAETYQIIRKNTLEEIEKLGIHIPDIWKETDHVFRQVTEIQGVKNQKAALQGAHSTRKPGALHERIWESVFESMAEGGNKYMEDVTEELAVSASSLLQYAVNSKMWDEINKLGRTKGFFVPQGAKEAVVKSGQEYTWAKRARDFVHQGARGEPPKPIFRQNEKLGLEPPKRLLELVNQATELSRKTQGRARQQAMGPLVEEIDALTADYSQKLIAARSGYKKAVENVNVVKQEGKYLGRFDPATGKYEGKGYGKVQVGMGPQGTKAQGRIFDLETQQFLIDHFDPLRNAGKLSTNVANIGQKLDRWVLAPVRLLQTGVDQGFLLITNLGGLATDFERLFTDPIRTLKSRRSVWVQASLESTKTLIGNPAVRARYWSRETANNPQMMKRFIQYVEVLNHPGSYANEAIEAWHTAGIFQRTPAHLITDRFGNAMAQGSNVTMWEIWKAKEHLTDMDPTKLTELGAHTRNISGQFRHTAATSHAQRQIERSFLLYAPSYFKTSVALLAKGISDPTSFGGRQALKGIAGMGAAAMTMLGTAVLAREAVLHDGDLSKVNFKDMTEETLEAMWPLSSKFASIRIGDNYIGVGGGIRSILGLLGQMAKNPEDLDNLDMRNPLVKFARGKAAYLPGVGWNIATGEDYLGNEIDGANKWFMLGEQAAPFSISAYFEANGDRTDKIGMFGASWFGGRTFPVSPKTLHEEATTKEFGITWDELQKDQYERYKDARVDPVHYPETAATWAKLEASRISKGDANAEVRQLREEKLRTETEPEMRQHAQGIKWGQVGGGKEYNLMRDDPKNRLTGSVDAWRQERGLGDPPEREGDEFEQEKLIDQYWQARGNPKQFKKQDGTTDYDKWKQTLTAIEAKLTPENRGAISDPARGYKDPTVREAETRRAQAGKDVDQWFQITKYKGLSVAEGKQVDELIVYAKTIQAKYGGELALDDILPLAAREKGLDPKLGNAARVVTDRKLSPLVVSTERDQWLMAHPDIIVFHEDFFDTLSNDDKNRWLERYRFR